MIWKRKWIKPSETLYWNKSTESWKRKKYILAEDGNGKIHCSCKAFVMNGSKRDCKHIKEFKSYPDRFKEIETEITGSLIELAEAIADEIDLSDEELKLANNPKKWRAYDYPSKEGSMSQYDMDRLRRFIRRGYLEERCHFQYSGKRHFYTQGVSP